MKRTRVSILIGGALAIACAAPLAVAGPNATGPAGEITERASTLLRQGEASWGEDREAAEGDIRAGVELLESLDGAGVGMSAERERTIGGGRLLLGDTGRAVLHLRRAHEIDPTDRATREMLAAARDRVGTAPAPAVNERARRALLWWRGYVSRGTLLGAALGGWALAWALLLARRFGAPRFVRPVGLVALALSVVSGGALASEEALSHVRDDAVVVVDNVTAHNGPSADLYPPTFTEPLEAGLEVVVGERRDGWARVRLASGQETWVPEPAIELVRPRAVSPTRGE